MVMGNLENLLPKTGRWVWPEPPALTGCLSGKPGRESSSQLGCASTDKAATGRDRPRLPRSRTQTNTWLLLKKLLTRIRTLLSILTNKQTNKNPTCDMSNRANLHAWPLGPPWSYSAPAGSARAPQADRGWGGPPPEGAPGNPAGNSLCSDSGFLLTDTRTAFYLPTTRMEAANTGPGIQCPGHRGRPCPSPRSTHPTSESAVNSSFRGPQLGRTQHVDRILFMFKLLCVCTGQIFLCMAGFQITFTLY